MKRRAFIAGLGSTVAWPLAARAQQPALPVIGYLTSRSRDDDTPLRAHFLRGLSERGYIEGRNIAIEYRFAEYHYDRLPALAAELVQRRVDVILAGGNVDAALAAKAVTNKIPIIFLVGVDPVETGLVASLNRPGGNVTGVTILNIEIAAKRLDLLRQLVPTATSFAVLTNPANAGNEPQIKKLQFAAPVLGVRLLILGASSQSDFASAFGTLAQQRAGGLLVMGDPFFVAQRDQLTALAARYAVPAIYQRREEVAAGGLMSYGGNLDGLYHLGADYVARILNGERPADLPVQQQTKLQLVINMKTAKALGLTVPPSVLVFADEVIE
jgi:putative tryptophan/tyrosine transport system substrate-binding protein